MIVRLLLLTAASFLCMQATFIAVASHTKFGVNVSQSGAANETTYLSRVNTTQMLASAVFTPPHAPAVFTVFLLGSKPFGYSLVPQVDAPERGLCKPSS